jgi:ribosomal protein L44E
MSQRQITRNEAITQGLPRFFTGKPCARGHVSERWTASKNCVECETENRRAVAKRYKEAKAAREAAEQA